MRWINQPIFKRDATFGIEHAAVTVFAGAMAARPHRPLSSARFYAILDTGYANPAHFAELCRTVLAGGADVIQLRAKMATTSQRIEWLQTLAPLCTAAQVPLICNDDLTAALAVPGVGLHIGQDDLPPGAARTALGPDRFLGLSTHSLAQAQAALALGEVLNYFAVGPVFPTMTKPDYPAVGLELVRSVAALTPSTPWFCIGGINRLNAAQVRSAGASAIVAVSEVLRAPDPENVVRHFRKIMETRSSSTHG